MANFFIASIVGFEQVKFCWRAGKDVNYTFFNWFKVKLLIIKTLAKYKTRNTGTENGMWGTRGMGGMLYSGECHQTFRGMLLNIPGNVTKHSGECPKIFGGMSSNIPENVTKHSGECRQIFRGMSSKILGNVIKHSWECCQFLV